MTMMIQPSVPISVIDVPIASPNGRVTQFGADGAPRAQSWDRSAGRTYTADSNTSNDRSNNGINRSNRNVLLYNNSKSNGNAEDVKVTVHHQQPQFKQLPYSHHHHHHNSIISSSPATTPTCLSETTPRNDSSNKHQQQYHHKSNHHNNNNNININMMHAVTPTSYNNNNGNGMMMMMNARPGNNNNFGRANYTADSNTSNNGINRSNRNVLLHNNISSNISNAEDVKVSAHHQQPQFKQLPYSHHHHHHHHNSIISSSPATTPTCLSETTPRNDSNNQHQQQYHHNPNHHNNNNNSIDMMHAVTPTSYNNNNGNGMMMMMNARPGNNNNTPQPNRLYINTGMQHNHNDIPRQSNEDDNTIISSLQCGSIQLNPYWNASYDTVTPKPIPTFIIVPIKNKMENNATEQINSTFISKSLSTAEETIDTSGSSTTSSSSTLDDDIAIPTFKKKNRSFRKMLSFKRQKTNTKCKKQTNGMIDKTITKIKYNNTPQPNRLYINTTFGMQHNHNDIPRRSNDDDNTIISSLQCGSIQLNPYWNASYEVETTKPIPTFIIVPIIKNKMENNTTEQINSTIISKSLSTAEETIDTTSSTTSSSSSALDDDIAMPTFKKKNRSSFRKMLSFKRMKNDTKCKKQTNGMIV
eukprot:CAMPEP_0119572234 /NCGR_PEP_ID=MMETSP1352-20130426/44515_1 /TAXON_ID=265584 /ORGANISM="Stauroneis constricta, Strain CCMP1120" /LENGTH=639 /DNA_ID=CAMNT_0007621919 /DNA_START=110 /DNA_END=2027 /DNA_ORIENTATION=+